MDTPEFRRPRPDEIVEFLAVSVRSYGSDDSPDHLAWEALSNEPERSIGVVDGSRWVAGAGAFSLEVTMPGGAILPAAGVTMIGLEPTYRRRGILTGMLTRLHEDARDRGEPIALLTASETSIYRRFGYGVSADVARLAIAADAVRFDPPPADPGTFTMLDLAAPGSVDTIATIHDRVRRTRPGWLSVTPGMWAQITADPTWERGARSPLRGVVHNDRDGQPDGYALWRVEQRSEPDRLAGNTLHLEHLTGASSEVDTALWAFVASVDLVTTVVWDVGPCDPDIRWRLVEPRQLRIGPVVDMVWARLLDVPAVLSARTYGCAGTLAIDVADRFHPDSGGRFVVESDGRGVMGRCHRPGADVDDDLPVVTLDTADLASIAMGAVTPTVLAATGRLSGDRGAVGQADALFTVPRRPWWPIEF
ncbi:MAG: GNAT family N-acetyltransferase [Actinobacteria bacterium]|nr:GNAT family N-acetyltransferase [Actinomycetota bacterium]